MVLLGYKITIEKLPKVTAETIFKEIEYSFRDEYDEDYCEYHVVSKSMYREIKRLAKEDYDYHTRDSRQLFPSGDDISYFRFEVVKNKFFNRVLFKVTFA